MKSNKETKRKRKREIQTKGGKETSKGISIGRENGKGVLVKGKRDEGVGNGAQVYRGDLDANERTVGGIVRYKTRLH